MAKKTKDITETGKLTARELQQINQMNLENIDPSLISRESDINERLAKEGRIGPLQGISSYYDRVSTVGDYLESSSLTGQQTKTGNQDYWGNSFFDDDIVVGDQDWNRLSDIRAENQPWYSKLVNGIGKAGVLAATTALEGIGLLYGIGQGINNAINAEEGKGWQEFGHGFWDNPATSALQKLNDYAEEYMPNYYTQQEQESNFNLFTANFLGDKLIKNFGFMVGAFYGGLPLASAGGKIGQNLVKNARRSMAAERMGAARKVRDIYREANKIDDVVARQSYIDDALSTQGLTQAERAKKMKEGLDHINDIARTTRATTQLVGSLASAINEGAIEAITNSKDWADLATQQENDRYQQALAREYAKIDEMWGDTTVGQQERQRVAMEQADEHQRRLDMIDEGRAKVGNADLLMNLPILMYSNMLRLGKAYTRGFDSARRQMGSFWDGHKLSGDLASSSLKSNRTWKGALLTGLRDVNMEGTEEFLQRAASDGAGAAVNASIERAIKAGKSEESKTTIDDYIAGFGKAVADNLGNPSAWEEYMIGALSSAVGMPVFGSQVKNAQVKLGPVGLSGGLYGSYKEEMDKKADEERIANYLNGRVKEPKFKVLYDNLRKQRDLDKMLEDAVLYGDKKEYKDIEFEKLFEDINAAASAGHLEEFKELINYDGDYTDEDLNDLIKSTTKIISPEEQRQRDEKTVAALTDRINELEGIQEMTPAGKKIKKGRAMTPDEMRELTDLKKQRKEVQSKLDDPNSYQQSIEEGPFIDANGEMTASEQAKEKMKEILENNKNTLNRAIDDFIKIRNEIDIETDGRLKDKDIAALTRLKASILNREERSAEITDRMIEKLPPLSVLYSKLKSTLETYVNNAQTRYNNAVEEKQKVDNNEKSTKKEKETAAENVQKAKDRLDATKKSAHNNNEALKLIEMLMEEKETTSGEKKAFNRGYGSTDNDASTRAINSEEAQAILARHPDNLRGLMWALRNSGLDSSLVDEMTQDALDLYMLGAEKLEYDKMLREAIKDPSLLNEASKKYEDKLNQEQKDNKISELALQIGKVHNMSDLNAIMKDAAMNPEIMNSALQKARQEGDDTFKNFVDDYQNGFDYMKGLDEQLYKLPSEFQANIASTMENAWQGALAKGLDTKNYIRDFLNDAIDVFKQDGFPQTAEALRKMLDSVDKANSTTATNSSTKRNNDNIKKEEEKKDTSKSSKNDKQKEPEKKSKKEEKVATPEEISAEIVREVANGIENKRLIDRISALSSGLQKKIDTYNKAHEDQEELKVGDANVWKVLQLCMDEAYRNEAKGNTEDDDSFYEETRAQAMIDNLKSSFKSDGQATEFEMYSKGALNFLLEYPSPYEPRNEREAAIQNILKEYRAYDFMNQNYLGYIIRGTGGMPKLHVLKATQREGNLNNPDKATTFLAIEIGDSERASIGKYAFNNPKADLTGSALKIVPLNGKNYQIVGVLSINTSETGIDPAVAEAFIDFQNSLEDSKAEGYDDIPMHTAIGEERKKDNTQPFLVSDKTLEIDEVYTGRLQKFEDEKDAQNLQRGKVSLHTFLTTANRDRAKSTEFEHYDKEKNSIEFPFGVVVNGGINTNATNATKDHMVDIRDNKWKSENNGAVLFYIPKPDGKLYPVRCTRRRVSDWWNSKDTDGSRSGEELLNAVLNGKKTKVHNGYLEHIIGHIETLLDENATFGDKIDAKYKLAKYFLFDTNPIRIDEATGVVNIELGNGLSFEPADGVAKNVNDFFGLMRDNNILFSLPSPSLENESINSLDIINSGIFEVGLSGFYNFNSNFTIKPVDGKGNEVIKSKVVPEGSGHFQKPSFSKDAEIKINFGNGEETYYRYNDNIVNPDGSPAPEDKVKLINLYKKVISTDPTGTRYLLGKTGYDSGMVDAIMNFINSEDGKKIGQFNSLRDLKFYIEKDGDDVWVVYPHGSGNTEMFNLNSPRGKELFDPVNKKGEFYKALNLAKNKLISVLKDRAKGSKGNGSNSSNQSDSNPQTSIGDIVDRLFNAIEAYAETLPEWTPQILDRNDKEAIVQGIAKIKNGDVEAVNNQIYGVLKKTDHDTTRYAKLWNNRSVLKQYGFGQNDIANFILQNANDNKGSSSGNENNTQGKGQNDGQSESMFAGVTLDNLDALQHSRPSLQPLSDIYATGNKKMRELVKTILDACNTGTSNLTDAQINEQLQDILKTQKENKDKNVLKEKINKLMTDIQCRSPR